MTVSPAKQLAAKRCSACEGGAVKFPAARVREQMQALCRWELIDDGRRIRKDWEVEDFSAGMEFLNQVAGLAEEEGHHPDLRLEGYRRVGITLWTHALGGLSENDFVLAAKIDRLPLRLRSPRKGERA